jgi:hypothetical protein
MITTTEELIQSLRQHYHPDEVLVYTLYSKEDVEPYLSEETDVTTVWENLAGDFDGAIEMVQQDLNYRVEELVSDWEMQQEEDEEE